MLKSEKKVPSQKNKNSPAENLQAQAESVPKTNYGDSGPPQNLQSLPTQNTKIVDPEKESQTEGKKMKKLLIAVALLAASLGLSACNGAFWTGAGGGTAATGAGYEVNAKVKMDQLKKDLDEGKISQAEYDIRVDQIKKMSVFY